MSEHEDLAARANGALSRRIASEIEAAELRVREKQDEASREFRQLRARHETFLRVANELLDDAGNPLQTLAQHFDNAEVRRSSDLDGFRAVCTFKHTPRFPASAELRFDITHDEDVRRIVVTKNVSILPVFMDFERSGRFVLELENGDRQKALAWIQDEVVSFVKTYLRIQFVDQYQSANLATDPVAKVQFSKNFSAGEVEFQGTTYYFLSEETRKEFEADPKRFVES
jgi:YHS domain-containing protein